MSSFKLPTLLISSLAITGCSSLNSAPYSFAPPPVAMTSTQSVSENEAKKLSTIAAPGGLETSSAKKVRESRNAYIEQYNNWLTSNFERNPKGGILLIDKFIKQYEIAFRETANGRQVFELPSLAAAIGGVAATAFGGNPDAVLFGGAVSSTLGAGNKYYAPQAKAEMYADALNALICLRQVADGGKAKNVADTIGPLMLAENNAGLVSKMSDLELDEKMYRSIENGVLGVRTVLSHRLLSAGQFTDASALADQFKTAVLAELEAAQAAKEAADAIQKLENDGIVSGQEMALLIQNRQLLDSGLDGFQAQLKICVLRAKA
ncbi:hypothetical protein [Parasphingorhabdus cellanae]|uniref:Lipoprotein n=1 Tax=Parasphingorhabdus cellanae TaxID=2806553 RepID=A0ABX7TA14_9SPHN|nr:hypothetical protein [Parasphingorhabdus cellanae]QTD57192.1 hypothetical protein J4G78_06510 [Parasphingorhabdus cellanae]